MRIIIEDRHDCTQVREAELRSFPKHSFALYIFLVDPSTGMVNCMDNFRCVVPLSLVLVSCT